MRKLLILINTGFEDINRCLDFLSALLYLIIILKNPWSWNIVSLFILAIMVIAGTLIEPFTFLVGITIIITANFLHDVNFEVFALFYELFLLISIFMFQGISFYQEFKSETYEKVLEKNITGVLRIQKYKEFILAMIYPLLMFNLTMCYL